MSRALTRKLLCSAILATLTAGQAGWAMGSGRPPSCAAAPGVVVKAMALDRICAAFDRARAQRPDGGALLLRVLAFSETAVTLRLDRDPPLPNPMERSLSISDRALSPDIIARFIDRMLLDLPPA